jgi:hypothetical protein
MAGLPTYGSELCFGLPEPKFSGTSQAKAKARAGEKRGYPLTVAGTAAELKRNALHGIPFSPQFYEAPSEKANNSATFHWQDTLEQN